MNATCFVDTNVFVYFRDATEPAKQARAAEWLSLLWQDRTGRVSTQVLNEYYVTATRKLDPSLSHEEARSDIRSLMAWNPVVIDQALVERGWVVQDELAFSWWDSLVIAAAQLANCRILLSEDMQDGQEIGSMRIVNPFLHAPADVMVAG